MTTSNKKNKWNDRLKTADNQFVHDILQNFGLSGGLSAKDLPFIPLTGLAALGISQKLKERKERKGGENNIDDNQRINDFSENMSKMRDIIDQRKTDRPIRNHPSVPGFTPDVSSPYGIFDQDSGGYVGGPAPDSNNVKDISEHPRFNAGDQGRSQRGRPFDRDEE